jgi:hypothetical protein
LVTMGGWRPTPFEAVAAEIVDHRRPPTAKTLHGRRNPTLARSPAFAGIHRAMDLRFIHD